MGFGFRSIWIGLLVALLPAAAAAQASRDANLYRWDGRQWTQVEGAGTRVAIAPDGTPWVVTSGGQIYSGAAGRFRQMPGGARDIAVGGDGRAWIIGTDSAVYRWSGRDWERLNGTGVAISADETGTPWVVGANDEIYAWLNNRFVLQVGSARDIGAGRDMWIVSPDGAVRQLTSSGWGDAVGTGVRVSAGAPGTAFVVNDSGHIYKWENGAFQAMPGEAQDVAANIRGDVWMVGIPVSKTPAPRQATPRRRR